MIEVGLAKAGIKLIAGVDEAGRGACAGPLVIAALILRNLNEASLIEVTDSKQISPAKREALYPIILDAVIDLSVIEISANEIDEKGLHNAILKECAVQ